MNAKRHLSRPRMTCKVRPDFFFCLSFPSWCPVCLYNVPPTPSSYASFQAIRYLVFQSLRFLSSCDFFSFSQLALILLLIRLCSCTLLSGDNIWRLRFFVIDDMEMNFILNWHFPLRELIGLRCTRENIVNCCLINGNWKHRQIHQLFFLFTTKKKVLRVYGNFPQTTFVVSKQRLFF